MPRACAYVSSGYSNWRALQARVMLVPLWCMMLTAEFIFRMYSCISAGMVLLSRDFRYDCTCSTE